MSALVFGACRPASPQSYGFEWEHPSPGVGGATLDEFLVTPLSADGAGGLWFGYKNRSGRGGVGHFVPGSADDEWQIHPARIDGQGPGSGFVLALLPDSEGGVWVGSLHDGLSHYDAQVEVWQSIEALADDVMAVVADDTHLWLATFGGGVVQFDPVAQEWTAHTSASTDGGVSDDDIVRLIADGAGGLWAGTYGGGVIHYDPSRDAWRPSTVESTNGKLGNDDVRALAMDKAGGLWVGTFGGGISHYDPQRDVWELHTMESTGRGLVSDYAITLLPDEHGGLWAGLSNLDGEGGLAYFDDRAWRSYTVASTGGGLLSDDVRALAPDGLGGAWIGTRAGGLSHLEADLQTWTTYTVDSTGGGLAGDTVLALLPDGAGGVWVGTASGLSRLHPRAP